MRTSAQAAPHTTNAGDAAIQIKETPLQDKTSTCSHAKERHTHDKENSAPWLLRVIPNKFPAVAPLAANNNHYAADVLDHMVLRDPFTNNNEIPALGFHEVIIESAQHNHVPATGSPQDLERLLFAMRSRLMCLHTCAEYARIHTYVDGYGGMFARVHIHVTCMCVCVLTCGRFFVTYMHEYVYTHTKHTYISTYIHTY
jgi:hypothetical protein